MGDYRIENLRVASSRVIGRLYPSGDYHRSKQSHKLQLFTSVGLEIIPHFIPLITTIQLGNCTGRKNWTGGMHLTQGESETRKQK